MKTNFGVTITHMCSHLGATLPLSVLQLMVPPVRLMSAAIWQTIQQKVLSDYGMLEEFVSIITDIVPDLLTAQQRAQLTLGLRAQVRRSIRPLLTTNNYHTGTAAA